MRLFFIGKVNVQCNPLIIVLFAILAVLELLDALVIALISLTLHELSHCLIARRLGYKILSVELQPFGFVAHIGGTIKSLGDEIAIFSSGILFSFLAGCVSATVCGFMSDAPKFLYEFSRFNFFIAFINAMPAIPLDGGRVVKSLLLKKIPARTANKILSGVSLFISLSLIGSGIFLAVKGIYNLTFFTMGIFLAIAVLNEKKHNIGAKLKETVIASLNINSKEAIEVNHIAMHKSVLASDAILEMKSYKYTIVAVLDDYMNYIGEVNEAELVVGSVKKISLLEILNERTN
ncbi:MAG: hypothetical protein RRY79_02100 [Clostridia bacterium]